SILARSSRRYSLNNSSWWSATRAIAGLSANDGRRGALVGAEDRVRVGLDQERGALVLLVVLALLAPAAAHRATGTARPGGTPGTGHPATQRGLLGRRRAGPAARAAGRAVRVVRAARPEARAGPAAESRTGTRARTAGPGTTEAATTTAAGPAAEAVRAKAA